MVRGEKKKRHSDCRQQAPLWIADGWTCLCYSGSVWQAFQVTNICSAEKSKGQSIIHPTRRKRPEYMAHHTAQARNSEVSKSLLCPWGLSFSFHTDRFGCKHGFRLNPLKLCNAFPFTPCFISSKGEKRCHGGRLPPAKLWWQSIQMEGDRRPAAC